LGTQKNPAHFNNLKVINEVINSLLISVPQQLFLCALEDCAPPTNSSHFREQTLTYLRELALKPISSSIIDRLRHFHEEKSAEKGLKGVLDSPETTFLGRIVSVKGKHFIANIS